MCAEINLCLFFPPFISYAFGVMSKEPLPNLRPHPFLFSSKRVEVLVLAFRLGFLCALVSAGSLHGDGWGWCPVVGQCC